MDTKLRKLQMTQLEILELVDSICKEYDIKYSLHGGTLLGAVRHQGFIPWDDDLDICMERTEYDKFLKLWPQLDIQEYVLFNKEIAPAFDQSFTKIRKNHTTYLQDERERGIYHTGFFIDIFPLDRIPNGVLQRKFFIVQVMLYQLFTRGFVPPKGNIIVKMISNILLRLISKEERKKFRDRLLISICKHNEDSEKEVVGIETIQSTKKIHPADLMDEIVSIQFEGREFSCFADYDGWLRRTYGNYMLLPPEEERGWKHHPIILDFDKSYDELDISIERM